MLNVLISAVKLVFTVELTDGKCREYRASQPKVAQI